MAEDPSTARETPRFTRSTEYKTVFSDVYRPRLGNGDITIVFSKIRHDPGVDVSATSAEEQLELVLPWNVAKMLSLHLSALIAAMEDVLGPIPSPTGLRVDIEEQRQAVRSLGLSVPSRVIADAGEERNP
jgi:hypothetical protein